MATISAPNTKNVITWKIELTFSAKSWKRSGISCSVAPSAIPATNAAIRPFPNVTSARP